jgi:hypothetical protein
VNDKRVSDPELREGVQDYLSPNPDLADLIERECAKGWEGIIERLFPNISYIQSIYSGAMLPYIAPLRHYTGNVPLMNSDYGASESWIAINLDPTCPPENTSFTFIPDFAYFEFIPVHRESAGFEFLEDDSIVGLTDLKIGQEYEVVLTTVAGTISFLTMFDPLSHQPYTCTRMDCIAKQRVEMILVIAGTTLVTKSIL